MLRELNHGGQTLQKSTPRVTRAAKQIDLLTNEDKHGGDCCQKFSIKGVIDNAEQQRKYQREIFSNLLLSGYPCWRTRSREGNDR